MSEPRSSFFRMLQRPQFWIPCSAAVMTLVFLGKWVLDPETELPETSNQSGIVNDQAQQDLTPEESALGSEIDNLEVLMSQLEFESSTLEPSALEPRAFESSAVAPRADQNLAPASPSETSLTLPRFSFTNTAPNTTSDPENSSADLNPPDSSFLSRSAQNAVAPAADSSLVIRNEAGTLQLSLTAPSQSLFGTPQTLGLPQRDNSGTLQGTAVTPQPTAGTIVSPTFSSNPALPYPYNTTGGTTAPVQNLAPVNQTSNSSLPPINPYTFSPYPNSPKDSNGLVPSPYSPHQSFNDPLSPPLVITPQPGRTLAPGQYIGNGEINTFANP